jgi:hypothetical protein
VRWLTSVLRARWVNQCLAFTTAPLDVFSIEIRHPSGIEILPPQFDLAMKSLEKS